MILEKSMRQELTKSVLVEALYKFVCREGTGDILLNSYLPFVQ